MLDIALHSLFRLLTPVINVSRQRASDYRYIFYLTAVDDVFGADYKRLGSVDTWFLVFPSIIIIQTAIFF